MGLPIRYYSEQQSLFIPKYTRKVAGGGFSVFLIIFYNALFPKIFLCCATK